MNDDTAAYAPDHPVAIDSLELRVQPMFVGFPKVPRLNRDMVITEKIDGTNAAIGILPNGRVYAQSRKRIITPGKATDNAGFAGWVHENAALLTELLGPGLHFGEWYGPGIQGNRYDVPEKRFALFNTMRWGEVFDQPYRVGGAFLHVVPVLYIGRFSSGAVATEVSFLRTGGSRVFGALGQRAEGVIVYHIAANQAFKVTLENDGMSKGEAEARARRWTA